MILLCIVQPTESLIKGPGHDTCLHDITWFDMHYLSFGIMFSEVSDKVLSFVSQIQILVLTVILLYPCPWLRLCLLLFRFTYSVHFRTDPLLFGGCVTCPQVQTRRVIRRQFRTSVCCLESSFWSGADTFGIYLLSLVFALYIWIFGYGGALSRLLILLCMLEACRNICGLWVVIGQVCMFEGATLSVIIALTASVQVSVCTHMYMYVCATHLMSVWIYVCWLD